MVWSMKTNEYTDVERNTHNSLQLHISYFNEMAVKSIHLLLKSNTRRRTKKVHPVQQQSTVNTYSLALFSMCSGFLKDVVTHTSKHEAWSHTRKYTSKFISSLFLCFKTNMYKCCIERNTTIYIYIQNELFGCQVHISCR